jgi:Holliday junction resolvase RusA-like endonuclease
MDNIIEFKVHHRPQPQPRPKARRLPMGVQIYTPKSERVRAWKDSIRDAFRNRVGSNYSPVDGLVVLSVVFEIERPKYLCATKYPDQRLPHTSKPDIDNLIKGAMDALSGVAWIDDCQVWLGSCEKYFNTIILGGPSGRKRLSSPSVVSFKLEIVKQ